MNITESCGNRLNTDTGYQKKEQNSGKFSVHIGFNASGTMARIASAKTKSQVSAIERSLRATLKDAVRHESDDDTIKAIKKAIGKANKKVKALGKEERMENAGKAAKSAGNTDEELRIAKELAQKRNARQRKERADIADTGSAWKTHSRWKEEMRKSEESNIDVLCDETGILSDVSADIDSLGMEVDICL